MRTWPVAMMLLLASAAGGCAPDQTGPASGGDVAGPSEPPAHGGQPSNGALAGEWEVTTVIQIGGDFQVSTTRWLFTAGGACARTVTTKLVSEDIPRTTNRTCTYGSAVGGITVRVPGSADATFSVSFAAFSPDRLVLDGLEYRRIG